MNPLIEQLQPYPFARLKSLLGNTVPNQSLEPARLSIGEPEHSPPAFVADILASNSDNLRKYPATSGIPELKSSIANWATRRFNLDKDALCPNAMILPCNGTREALFSIVQTLVNTAEKLKPLVLMPNPFYQIYEGAAILAGAEPAFIHSDQNTQLPDFDSVMPEQWQQCQLLFICTPGNPSGVALPIKRMQQLIELANEYDFVIASDECYSELYLDEENPVPGLLEASASLGHADFKRCLVFHSLSKRSNLAGLRSGFVAGDPDIMKQFLSYRTYHGSAMSIQNQLASAAAWDDEKHVVDNRALYRRKYDLLCPQIKQTFDFQMPDAGFYLWLKTPKSDTDFAKELYRDQHLTVLPGSFLARSTLNGNPGENYIRLALTSPIDKCQTAVDRLIVQVHGS